MRSCFFEIFNKEEFFCKLNQINSSNNSSGIHGAANKEGLIFSSGEIIKWNELTCILTEINVNLGNELLLTMASCYGGNLINIIKHNE